MLTHSFSSQIGNKLIRYKSQISPHHQVSGGEEHIDTQHKHGPGQGLEDIGSLQDYWRRYSNVLDPSKHKSVFPGPSGGLSIHMCTLCTVVLSDN